MLTQSVQYSYSCWAILCVTITILHVSAITVCLSIRSCLVESYKKKTKLELQRSIKSLKDDNAMFTKLNQDLRRILTGVSYSIDTLLPLDWTGRLG